MNNDPECGTSAREREIFLAALEVDGASERKTLLDGACGDDAPLRARIESLLASIDDATIRKPLGDITDLPTMPGSTPTGSNPGRWEPPPAEEVSAMLDAYEVTEILGRGGMGAVYKGVQSSLDRPVAIKLLPPELGSDAEFEARFRREAKSMARLNHPNIVQIYDFGEAAAGYHYIVMEFVDGTDLQHLIRSGKLDTEQALRAVGQICDALEYAHGEGYVHRDIKPANIFLDQKGTVKVGDFGLAKLVGDEGDHYLSGEIGLTQSGMAMGTPLYIAPEQLEKGAKSDRRADIYSLGVMFYEMLTGQIPRGSVRPPSQRVEKLDIRIDGIVFKAMEHDPDERYQSATDLRKEVETIQLTKDDIAGKPRKEKRKKTKPPSRPKNQAKTAAPAGRPAKKSTIFSIAAALLLLAAGGTYVATQNYGGDPTPPGNPNGEEGVAEVPKSGGGSPEKPAPEVIPSADKPVPPPVGTSTSEKGTSTPPKPESRLATIPLAVPTRDFPDLSKLPRGKVKTFGRISRDIGEIADISDFVEVKLWGQNGWAGLRANGDLIVSEPHRIRNIEGLDVRTLNRAANPIRGPWLTSTGVPGMDLAMSFEGMPKSGIADYARSDGHPEITILKNDGSLIYHNVGTPLPADDSDFVRIETGAVGFFGIRESGALAFWGKSVSHREIHPDYRFVKLDFSGFHFTLGLTVEGEVFHMNVNGPLTPAVDIKAEGPMIDIVSGSYCYAARRTDGTWFASASREKPEAIVQVINNLGPNVPSLSFINGDSLVWIETDG